MRAQARIFRLLGRTLRVPRSRIAAVAPEDGSKGGLEAFAAANRLGFEASASLPAEGALLSTGGDVEGAVTGALPGGLDGTLAHYTYTTTSTDSDGHTSTSHHHYTLVVGRVPESIGFAPHLAFRGRSVGSGLGLGGESKKVEAVGDAIKGATAYAYDGTSDQWLTQLFSPALIDWLGRSPDDFGFELNGGVLCAVRSDYLSGDDLTNLSTDAAHVAQAITNECQEAVDSGAAATQGAHSKPPDPKLEKALGEVVGEGSPDHLGATTGAFRKHLFATPGTYLTALLWGLVVAAIFNVFLLAITINLAVAHSYSALIIFEAALIGLCFLIALRWRVRDQATSLDPEAFFRGYARSRHLQVVDPLQFAATHADANLPFEPEWVFTGTLPGGSVDAALAVKGDGMKRTDQIAVIAGPSGPVAVTELTATAPGLSVANLDEYAAALSKQAAGQSAPAPTPAAPTA